MRRVKLLIADETTLLTPTGALAPRAIDTAARLRAAGIALVVIGAASPAVIARRMAPLALGSPLVGFDGAMIVAADGTILEQRSLPRAVAGEVLERLLAFGVEVWIWRGSEWLVRHAETPRARAQAQLGLAPTVIDDLRGVLDGVVAIAGVSDDPERLARAEAALRERVSEHAVVARAPSRLDVVHPEANPAAALRTLSRLLDVPLDEVATLGGRAIDVLMFACSGVSLAVGDASAEVQRSARYATSASEDDGFARAVERFVVAAPRSAQATLGLPEATRACLFDLDGVLTQTARLHAAAWKQLFDDFLREWSAQHRQPFVPFDVRHDYNQYVDGKLRIEGARSFLLSRGIRLGDEEVERLAEKKDQLLAERMNREPVEVYQGSLRYLQAARDAGLRTAVVSASKHTAQVLASAGIAELFDARIDGNVAAAEHLAGKPAPDTYLAAARAVHVEPAEAVVFEDALSGVEAGRRGHFGFVVGVDRVGQAAALRCHGADEVVTDLSALLVQR